MNKPPVPKQVTMSFDCTVAADVKDFEIVMAYLRLRSLRGVSMELEISKSAVSLALARYASVMARARNNHHKG